MCNFLYNIYKCVYIYIIYTSVCVYIIYTSVCIYIIYSSVCVYFYNKFIYVHTGLPGLPSCYLSASLILYEGARKCCLKAYTQSFHR